MNIATMIATTLAVTQFLKNALAKVNVVVEKTMAVILSVVVSVGVVLYFYVSTGRPITAQIVIDVIQVAIGANAGYSLIKVARPAGPGA
jgi:hypothetical protein